MWAGSCSIECAALAAIRPGLTVVISSGHITETMRAEACQAGVRELLHKEDTFDELARLLPRVLGSCMRSHGHRVRSRTPYIRSARCPSTVVMTVIDAPARAARAGPTTAAGAPSRTWGVIQLLVLLLVSDQPRRRRLANACRAASPELHCIEAADEASAMFGVAPDRLDLVVLDPAADRLRGGAWAVNWRRMATRAEVLLLEPDPKRDLDRLRRALRKILGDATT